MKLNFTYKIKQIIKKLLPIIWIDHLRSLTVTKEPKLSYLHTRLKKANIDKKLLKIIATSGSSLKYNGGTKIYNLWMGLLKRNNFDAYIATVDGNYDRWLVNHQPVIGYTDVEKLQRDGFDVRILSSWLPTPSLNKLIKDGQFYYFDAELAWTLKFRKYLDYYLKKNKIAEIGTHSRYIQSWYIANYRVKPILINEWSDTSIFYEDITKRIDGRVGCMVDSQEDSESFCFLKDNLREVEGFEQIINIEGNEQNVADTLKTVDIFIGLNTGKHPLWGEGCPRTQQEAMHCGAVLVAFDCLGNREYLYHNWTGIMIPNNDRDILLRSIISLLKNKNEKERLRVNGMNLVKSLFSERDKFELVTSFLQIN